MPGKPAGTKLDDYCAPCRDELVSARGHERAYFKSPKEVWYVVFGPWGPNGYNCGTLIRDRVTWVANWRREMNG